MSLPIPDILQNAAAVIDAAKIFANNDTNIRRVDLKGCLEKVNSQDILAVLNEVGRVYQGIYNMQVVSLGSGADLQNKTLNIAFQVDFGMGPRPLVLKLPFDQAKQVVEQLQKDLSILKPPVVITNFGG